MPFSSLSQSTSQAASHSFKQRAANVGMVCLMAATLAACGSIKRGGPESAPPPMKPIDPAATAPQTRAPAQVATPVSAPAPVAGAQPVQAASAVQDAGPGPINVKVGLHRCELARRILVKRVASDGSTVQVNWNGKDYNLRSVTTQSGARRFEDSKAGIAWVVISAKAFLLDTKRGQMLANECNL